MSSIVERILTLAFDAGLKDRKYLGQGWSDEISDCLRMVGVASELWIDPPGVNHDLVLEVELDVPMSQKALPLSVEVCGSRVAEALIAASGTFGFHIPAALLAGSEPIRINFLQSEASQPIDGSGGYQDARLHSFGLRALRLSRLLPRSAPTPGASLEPAEMMKRFESLGNNCEFGLVQRRFKAEPLGLLRFSNIVSSSLLLGLRRGFEGFGDPASIEISINPADEEYVVVDGIYGIRFHTWQFAHQVNIDVVREKQIARLAFLRQKLLDDIEQGEKVFVLRRARPLPREEVLPIYTALNERGMNWLLWMVLADSEHPSGTVEIILPGLLCGYIDRFAPDDDAPNISLAAWTLVCNAAWKLVGGFSTGADNRERRTNPSVTRNIEDKLAAYEDPAGDAEADRAIFDEEWYLQKNPGVAHAVRNGQYESGWAHYVAHGHAERRAPGPPERRDISKVAQANPASTIPDSLLRHTRTAVEQRRVRRRIVFVGNCQFSSLALLYRAAVPADSDDEAVHIPSWEGAFSEQGRVIAEADILVQQVMDFAPKIGDLDTKAQTILAPMLTAPFLWPCTGHPHPKNPQIPATSLAGQYDAEIADSFLNRMIRDGVDVDIAVARYLETDFAKLRNVDMMKEIILEKQRTRDRLCGFRFADFIEGRFRTERLFRTPNHLEPGMAVQYASAIFERLGVDRSIIDAMQTSTVTDHYPPNEAPIHPSIISHYGLTYVDVNTKYRLFDEGSFSCAEYAERYMRYEWDATLHQGFELARSGQPDAAFPVLLRAVETTPRSATAWTILSGMLWERGRKPEAIAAARRALNLDPANAHYQAVFEAFTRQANDISIPNDPADPSLVRS